MELTVSLLRKLYIIEKFSTRAIERTTGRSRSVVYSRLKKFGIPPRNLSISHIRYPRKPFSGLVAEQAYLLGFAIGDLRVRRNGGARSSTIGIACSSNKPAQIELIEELFSKYGRVWKGKPNNRGVVSVEAFVDLSFAFLLPERRTKAVFARLFSRECFLSFLGGFTDAEGSIFITTQGNQAMCSWGNYNEDLLRNIKLSLGKLGVETGKLVCDHLKGYQGKDGYRRRADYYHITCNRKTALKQLLVLLSPYLRHADKRTALSIALANIALRDKKYKPATRSV